MRPSIRSVSLALASTLVASALVLGGCTTARVPEPASLQSGETTETSVFFATGRSLFEERRIVPVDGRYRAVLDEWLAATPVENSDVALVQPVADVLSVTLEEGVLTIDWAPAVLDFQADDREERIALAGILRMFGQFDEVEKIAFTVEGMTDGEIDGKSIRDFWGSVSLIDQPWDVLRPAVPADDGSDEDTTTTP